MPNEPQLSTNPERLDWETLQRPFRSDYPQKFEFLSEGPTVRPIFEMDMGTVSPRRSMIEAISRLGTQSAHREIPTLVGFLIQRDCTTLSLYEQAVGEECQFQRLGVLNLPPLEEGQRYSVTNHRSDGVTVWVDTPSISASYEFLSFRYDRRLDGIEMTKGEQKEIVSVVKSPRCDELKDSCR